jgi:hypothetical protein
MMLLITHFSQFLVTSFLIGLNILHTTLFRNALNLCYSLEVRDQIQTHAHETGGIIIILCIIIYRFLDMRQKVRESKLNNSRHSPE